MWLHSHKAAAAVCIWVDIASKIFAAVTTHFSPSKADEFFKRWMTFGRDDKIYFESEKSQSEKLEEMGFPDPKKNASVRPFYFVSHIFCSAFSVSRFAL